MSWQKPDTAAQVADEQFEADFLQDTFDGVMQFLSKNNVPTDNNGPETFIVIRNNIQGNNGERVFSGAIYIGKDINTIKNDLK